MSVAGMADSVELAVLQQVRDAEFDHVGRWGGTVGVTIGRCNSDIGVLTK